MSSENGSNAVLVDAAPEVEAPSSSALPPLFVLPDGRIGFIDQASGRCLTFAGGPSETMRFLIETATNLYLTPSSQRSILADAKAACILTPPAELESVVTACTGRPVEATLRHILDDPVVHAERRARYGPEV